MRTGPSATAINISLARGRRVDTCRAYRDEEETLLIAARRLSKVPSRIRRVVRQPWCFQAEPNPAQAPSRLFLFTEDAPPGIVAPATFQLSFDAYSFPTVVESFALKSFVGVNFSAYPSRWSYRI